MPRGGRRTGTPGKAYSNRSDLNKPVPIRAATGQQYGKASAQLETQRQMPIAPPPAPVVGGPGAEVGAAPGPAGPLPGDLTPLGAPTDRPDEPVMAGAPIGPGPGVEAVAPPAGPDSDLRLRLGAMYQAFPTEEIRQLIEMLDSEPV